MTPVVPSPAGDALVLAAGNGDRFQNGTRQSKLLQPFLGQPLILRTLDTVRQAGITSFEVVLGYQADRVRTVIERGAVGVSVHFTYNLDWHLENGVSVLAARARLGRRRFALLMGDHLFESPVLSELLQRTPGKDESLLAVDSRPADPLVAAEATKVQMEGSRIVAIGKNLDRYDALDTGLFVCAPALFDALEDARASGDTTLSGGIRQLAQRGLMFGVDVGDATWYDIDTLADLQSAETRLGAQPEPA
ncbi:MAG: NTP transferase domain-containing protein [Acidobacteria bacterium]|nr:NTP transferase domain-containing protein [Acidobacteriota bacterium]